MCLSYIKMRSSFKGTVSIPFYIVLFINIVHYYSIPVNSTYCIEQINESTKTDVFLVLPTKPPLTWCQLFTK